MRAQITDVLKRIAKGGVTRKEILSYLRDRYEEFDINVIEKLEENNIVSVDEDTNILSVNTSNFFVGKVESNKKGSKYIIHDGKTYKVNKKYYLNNDEVGYILIDNNVYVTKIKSRAKTNFICEIKYEHGEIKLIPFNEFDEVPIDVDIKQLKTCVDGDRILISLDTKLTDGKYIGNYVKTICNSRDMDSTIKTLCQYYGFPTEFSEEALLELRTIPTKVLFKDFDGRKDQRKQQFFTIDGSDTKDRDDAIAIEKLVDGYILRVNISDVAHYIKPGMALFDTVMERGNTVYTPGASNPQLPQLLTNGICSLHADVDRLTKTTEIRYDNNGNIVSYKIYDSVMNSKKAFTYDEVNDYFESGVIDYDISSLADRLDEARELSTLRTKIREKKGLLNFVSGENKFEVDSKHNITDVKQVSRKEAESLIENFMVDANTCMADYALTNEFDIIFRNHKEMDKTKAKSTISKIRSLNLVPSSYLKDTGSINDILNKLSEDENGYAVSRFLLCMLMRAEYSVSNIGHSGLGIDKYAHSTSPIRRGADLITQTMFDIYNSGVEYDKESMHSKIGEYARHFSKQEREAAKVEAIAENLKIFDYFKTHKIDSVCMTIIDCNEKYLTTKKMGLPDGIVPLENISETAYFNRDKYYVKDTKGKVFRVGDKINLVPSSVTEFGIMYDCVEFKKKSHTYAKMKKNDHYIKNNK